MRNIFYFKRICKMGGTEQFLYEIAKKYKNWDICVYYDEADDIQIKRLSKFIRCEQHIPGKKVECEKAFFNFNIDMIDDVEAKHYYFVSHAIWRELGYKPPIDNEKLTDYIGVSEYSKAELIRFAKSIDKDIEVIRSYNPLTLEPKEKVIKLVSASRMDDGTKGGGRTCRLIEALDRYCAKTGRHYIWLIFTNPTRNLIDSPNVIQMKPRIDVRPYIANADWCVQVSNNMETYCYTINEALGYGVPVVTTPLTVMEELPITDNERITLDWECENVDDVARQIFEKKVKPFTYTPPKDSWDKILAPGKSTYFEDMNKLYKVRATDIYKKFYVKDIELGYTPEPGEEFIVNKIRLGKLLGNNTHKRVYVELIGEYNARTNKSNGSGNKRKTRNSKQELS